jgi:hypothetical protein
LDYLEYYKHPVPSEAWNTVQAAFLKDATALLTGTPYREISGDLARRLSTVTPQRRTGEEFYLVRGLRDQPTTGKVSVFWHDGSVMVKYDTLGRPHAAIEVPIVIALPSNPRAVYVSCGGAM